MPLPVQMSLSIPESYERLKDSSYEGSLSFLGHQQRRQMQSSFSPSPDFLSSPVNPAWQAQLPRACSQEEPAWPALSAHCQSPFWLWEPAEPLSKGPPVPHCTGNASAGAPSSGLLSLKSCFSASQWAPWQLSSPAEERKDSSASHLLTLFF